MRLFDLHCDTITECCNKGETLFKNDLHISLSKAGYLNRWLQFFAIWMPDEYRGRDACDYFERIYRYYKKQMKDHADLIAQCETAEDLIACDQKGLYGGILSVEGGSAAAGDLERIGYLRSLGVRMMTLTWNGANEIADGCMVENAGGLTEFGKKAVLKMEREGMIIDVSHLGEKGFYDIVSTVSKPFVASHSNCSAVAPHLRNLTNEQISLIIENKGLIGVNLYPKFTGGDDFENVYAHIAHLLDIGGGDIVAIGCDFDGCDLPPAMNGIDKLKDLYDYLVSKGVPRDTVDAIFYDNAYKFFITALQDSGAPAGSL